MKILPVLFIILFVQMASASYLFTNQSYVDRHDNSINVTIAANKASQVLNDSAQNDSLSNLQAGATTINSTKLNKTGESPSFVMATSDSYQIDYWSGPPRKTWIPDGPYKGIIRIEGTKVVGRNTTGWELTNGTDGTDNALVINTVIAACDDNSRIYIEGDHELDDDIHIDGFDNIDIFLDGTLTLADDYSQTDYVGYYYDRYTAFAIHNSRDIVVNNLRIDGNKDNIARTSVFNLVYVRNSSCRIMGGELSNSKQIALTCNVLYNALVEDVKFTNCGKTGGGAPVVYTSGWDNRSTGTFERCEFTRDSLDVTTGQAFYMGGYGTFLYSENEFINMTFCYDFRNGVHNILSSYCDHSTIALQLQSTAFPRVTATNLDFRNVTCGALIVAGTADIRNSRFISDGASTSDYGISFRYPYCKNNVIFNNYISGFDSVGINVLETPGGHLIAHNEIVSCPIGIKSQSNTGKSECVNNFFGAGVATKFSNDDSNLIIESELGSYITKSSGATSVLSGANHKDVAHGLAITPAAETIHPVPKEDFHGHDYWISSTNSTHFVLTLNGTAPEDLDFGWSIGK